jgi:GT2 family glycosyltransferase
MKTVLCIAGMHRSGTSMITRLLHLCGLYLGNESKIIKPAPDNPEGFWENTDFVKINDLILSKFEAGWDLLPTMSSGWETSEIDSSVRSQAADLINQFENKLFWGWKDPRNSITLPFWMPLIPDLKVVICLRNPLDVAKSLTRRGHNSIQFGFNLWCAYNQKLIDVIPFEKRLITHYDSYFDDPQSELKRLLEFAGVSADRKMIQSACSTVLASNRHSRSTLDDLISVGAPKDVVRMYLSLCQESGQVFWGHNFDVLRQIMTENINEKRPEIGKTALLLRVREKEKENHELEMAIQELRSVKEKEIKELRIVNERREGELQLQVRTWDDRWADLESGLAWKTIKILQKWRLRLAPNDSIRFRILNLSLRAFFVWRQEGLRAMLKKMVGKVAEKNLTKVVRNELIVKKTPQASIIIPVYNALKLTQACIESIYRNTVDGSFELVIVDNASTDGTARWLKTEEKKYKNFKVLSMKQNIGFGPGVNAGIEQSKSKYIVILNNDTLVAPDWLEHLIAAAEKDTSIGIISPLTNYVGEGPQIDGDAKELSPDLDMIGQYANSIAERSDIFYEPKRLVFFCVLLKRELTDIIGDLDIGYEKGNFEDDDYCLRARMAGYRLAIAKNAFVYHHGSVTFKSNRISHTQYMEKNRERFYKKAGRIATTPRQGLTWPVAKKADVSVIVRTKDRPLLLRRALISLVNQTFRDIEVVLVNDGGEDVSGLIHSLKSQLSIRYIHHHSSKGRTAAINAGIENSQGKWIAYLDDDDIVYPWHLEALLQSAENNKEQFIYGDYNRTLFLDSRVTDSEILQGVHPWEYSHRELLVQNHIPIHTWLHARECIDTVGLWDESLDRLEDYEFLLRVSAKYRFHHLRKVICEYRYYLDSANSIYTDRQRTLDAINQIYQRNPVSDPDLSIRRQELIDKLEKQVHRIEEIRGQIGNTIDEATATREVIKLVVGL